MAKKKRKSKNYWTKLRVMKEARKFSGREEFRLKSRSAYNASRRLEIYEEVCEHMGDKKNAKHHYTYKQCKEIAAKFSQRTHFHQNKSAVYKYASEKGWLDKICKHMFAPSRKVYTYEHCKDLALQYEWLSDFRKEQSSAYSEITRMGYQELLDHLKREKFSYFRQKRRMSEIKEDAKKYKTKVAFKKYSNSNYNSMYLYNKTHKGFLEECTEHMLKKVSASLKTRKERGVVSKVLSKRLKRKDVLISKSSVWLVAKNYYTAEDFRKGEPELYKEILVYSRKNKGFLKELYKKIESRKIKGDSYWTKPRIMKEAKKYSVRSEFFKHNKRAYRRAKELGCFEKACAHMRVANKKENKKVFIKKLEYNKELLLHEMKKFKSFTKFRSHRKLFYRYGMENGYEKFMHDHFQYVPKRYWNKKKCKEVAKLYKYRTKFAKGEHAGAYNKALHNGWLDEICSHMSVNTKNSYNRHLYYFEFVEDKAVYVGLSYAPLKRLRQHISRGDSSVYKEFRKLGLLRKLKKIDNSNISSIRKGLAVLGIRLYISQKSYSVDIVGSKEIELVNLFKRKGYRTLNQSTGGALGGNSVKWTRQKVLEAAKRCKARGEFAITYRTAYELARSQGYLDEACAHMKGLCRDWSDEKAIMKEAKKYKYLNDFRNKVHGCYNAAKRKGILDKVTKHMKNRTISWKNPKKVIAEAKKYNSKKEFIKKKSGAYGAARRHNIVHVLDKYWASIEDGN